MFEKIILILLAILFLAIIPIYATYKYWNYKPIMKYAISLLWISYLVIIYEIFFPRDSYYLNHLKNASSIKFGDDFIVKEKYTSFMNSKAQYYSCAVFETTNKVDELIILKEENINKLPNFETTCDNMIKRNFDIGRLKIFKKIDEKSAIYWGYEHNNNKIFIVYQYFAMANKE